MFAASACGLGTGPGAPYDFATLDALLAPALSNADLVRVERVEAGSDCEGQGCERPQLSYRFKPKAPAYGCELVSALTKMFTGVTKPFAPTASNDRCSFSGELDHHGVNVLGLTNERGDRVQGPRDPLVSVIVYAFEDPIIH